MRLEFFIALRHLMSRERRALISTITGISILGVVVGVTALIMTLAVIEGAQEEYLRKMIDQYAHIEVWGPTRESMGRYDRIIEFLERDPDVVAASGTLQRHAMIKTQPGYDDLRDTEPARVYGIDPEREPKVSKLGAPQDLLSGSKETLEEGEVYLSIELARSLGIARNKPEGDGSEWSPGTDVYVVTGQFARTANGLVPKQARLRVVGISGATLFEVDQKAAWVTLATCQSINLLDDVVDTVHARVRDAYEAQTVKERLQRRIIASLGQPYYVRFWGELNPDFFRALKLQEVAMFVIVLLVIMVAALNVIGTLLLVTMEKTREIGILRATGASRRSIARIFIAEGVLIGLAGTLVGVAAGLGGCWLLEHHCPVDIPRTVYGLDGLPVLVRPWTVGVISGSAVVICLLASFIPAVLAARLRIVEALRYE